MDNMVSMSYGEWYRGQVRVGNRVIRIQPQQHKLVVALLRRHPEHWTTAKNLIDDMWGWSHLPDYCLGLISVYTYQLRDMGVPIETRLGRNGGYRIISRGRFA